MKLLLAFMAFAVGVSIACSASRSATSKPTPDNTTSAESPAVQDPAANNEKPACTLNLSQAPNLKGLALGMTADDLLALFPGSKDDSEIRAELARPANQFGTSSLFIKPSKYGGDKFADIIQVTAKFLDGKVSNLMVGYNGPEWPHVDRFVTQLVEGTSLPPADQWTAYTGLDTQLKILPCTSFEVRVFAGGAGGAQNYVQLQDLEAEKTLKDRRDKAKAKASPTPAE